MFLLQYEMDEEKVANLLQIPTYFELEIYVASRQEKVSDDCVVQYNSVFFTEIMLASSASSF